MDARYWVVMPAAGAGRRMGLSSPKQYLPLSGKTVIEWALQPFLDDARCQAVMVVLDANDHQWSRLSVATHPRVHTTQGGDERADSVRAGLAALALKSDDWVLVHDAARPCLQAVDLNTLIATLQTGEGGLLATPLTDTLKRAEGQFEGQYVVGTLPRNGLWRALTPQMFHHGLLLRALKQAAEQHINVTDEAAAVEALGFKPRLVAGRADNIKITVPEDLALAASILSARQGQPT